MKVLDSSIWIEFYRGSKLGLEYLEMLSVPADILVPTIVQHEVFKWLARVRTVEDANHAMTLMADCTIIDLTTAIAVFAADLSLKYKLHTTDAIIFATAQMYEATLHSCDAHFKDLPGVEYFEK